MRLIPFEMERWQSTWEHSVEINLSESGVEPLPLRDLMPETAAKEAFLDHPLAYSEGKGTQELRSLIAGMYPAATPDHVLVTNGSSEAAFLALWHLVEPGDEVVIMMPNYMEGWGLVQMFGGTVRPLWLREDLRWQFDPEELKSLVSRRTKAIAVCNPNNPTGAVMAGAKRKAILDAARDAGAWLLSDEVYVGAEREGHHPTQSLWGAYERTIVLSGLSKSYGLPGLRIGWAAGPPDTIATLWAFHDYTTLTPTYLSDRLAQIALSAERREPILARTRSIIRRNYDVLRAWIQANGPRLSHVPPTAGAICFIRYNLRIPSSDLAWRLLREKSTLLVPGSHFGMEGYIRIGMGHEGEQLAKGLARIDELFRELEKAKGSG